ncbi:hypothetical protein FSARC_13218 [Fusarium sarcochroum]|uniref:Major facilitator superfamily (MFS) profile domain-containing protein n=1 Tax=Fusarium sarcochroum TaxID=1208366 RepID=A0A8H4T304_9HYPO|nr:hypothetical protein FSARC_13218 [Fusarium sarcochroum]
MEHPISKDQMPKAQDHISNYSIKEAKVVAHDSSLEHAEIVSAFQSYVPGTAEERQLVRKADMVLLPLLWWMYILAYLDRGNIANANAAGMSEDLGMSESQYSLLVSLFFVAYVLFEVPSNMLLMKIKPSIYLPTICVVWGSVIIGMSQSKNSSSFLAGRFFLGAIEAGLFPGALFLLTCWYTKEEVGKRFCIFYTSGCVAPALGGIMAGAVISRLDGARGIAGWRWLLLIEGVVTVVCGFGLYFALPDYPRNSKMLTPEQRLLGHVRILHDHNDSVQPGKNDLTPLQAFAAVLKDGRTWLFLILYTCNILGLTISYFIPTMLKGLGYTSITAQWMTVPIWACGAVFQLFWSWTSDKTQDRRWHITGLLSISALSCLIAIVVRNNTVKYVMMCFLIGGMFTTVPLILNWTSEAMAKPERKRSIAIAFVNSFGHTSYIYGSYLWPASEGPRNLKGFAASNAVLGTAAVLAATLPIIFKYLPSKDEESVQQPDQATPNREGQAV